MCATDDPSRIHVRAMRHRAGVDNDQIGRRRIPDRLTAAILECGLNRISVRLRGTAAETLDKDLLHAFSFLSY
jgi:hypothetical protein